MVEVEVIETIECPVEQVLEFVMDPERYATVDAKIGPIEWVRGTVMSRSPGSTAGFPGCPAPPRWYLG